MMEINFIVTCYNREEYWPYLEKILKSYKQIKANVALVYTGTDETFDATIKILNRGHAKGDYDCIVAGYNQLKTNGCKRWIKIGVDSWLLNEDKMIEIFNKMESNKHGYGGIWWDSHKDDISTDIFFVDTTHGNVFEGMAADDYPEKYVQRMELYMAHLLQSMKITTETDSFMARWPTWSTGRFSCPALGWTMSHDLNTNIEFVKNYQP